MSKQKEVVIKARPHSSRKVVFVELIAEVLGWGDSVGLSGQQMTDLIDGFKESSKTWTSTWTSALQKKGEK